MDEFGAAVNEIEKIEERALKHQPYDGEIRIEKGTDFHPAEYIDMDYNDLMNLYERVEKIIKASQMLTKGAAMPPAKARATEKNAKEVEEKLKKITQEAMESAEKIKVAAAPSEKIHEEEKARLASIEIERERPGIETERYMEEKRKIEKKEEPAEIVIGEEEEKEERGGAGEEREIELPGMLEEKEEGKETGETEKEIVSWPEEKKEERAAESKEKIEAKEEIPERKAEGMKKRIAPSVSAPPVAEEAHVAMPSILESPDQAAEEKYKSIEQEVLSAIGENASDAEIKKKMLELTKELFKEKSTSRREKIKLEITVLKNIIAGKGVKSVRGATAAVKGKGKTEAIARAQLLETIASTQKIELSQIKDAVMTNYRSQLKPVVEKFQKKMAEGKPEEAKGSYDEMVFTLTSLSQQMPAVILKYREYLKKKHNAEINNIEKGLTDKEKETLKRLKERKREIAGYDDEFKNLMEIINKEIDSVIRNAGREVFRKSKEEEEIGETDEERIEDIISAIDKVDEGTLLYYLHSREPEYYKMYERQHVSKAEALSHAKITMAREKGLKDSIIKKYFGNAEG